MINTVIANEKSVRYRFQLLSESSVSDNCVFDWSHLVPCRSFDEFINHFEHLVTPAGQSIWP